MQILYIYDIKARNKREFNRVKRVFYYRLNKFGLLKSAYRTKSVLIVDEKKEKLFDDFFAHFKGKLEGYKVYADSIETL